MLVRISQSKSKICVAVCVMFLLGVAVASLLEAGLPHVPIFLCGALVLVSLMLAQHPIGRLCILCFFGFFTGSVRYQQVFEQVKVEDHIATYLGKQVVVEGLVSVEPDVRQDGVRYVVKSLAVSGDQSVVGNMYLKTGLYPRFAYGDKLSIDCQLKKPEPIETEDGVFRYDLYLARIDVFVICVPKQIQHLQSGEGVSRILLFLYRTKAAVADKVNLLWHEPYAGFMAGLLYGYRGGLGSLTELFSITGVTHIIAISGYNISLVANILLSFFIRVMVPRKKAFWWIVFGISLFVIFVGASASVVRAGVMGIIVLLAKQVGRSSRVGKVMLFAAVLMCLENPLVLMWDAGFQLSFLSTLGLVYVSPIVERFMRRIPEVYGLKETFVATISATLATLPLILFQFGRLSIVSIAVNMAILWTLPYIMTVGFFSVMIAFVWMSAGEAVAVIGYVGMAYVVQVVRWFAGLSYAAVALSIPWWGMLVGYVLLICIVKIFTPICKKKS